MKTALLRMLVINGSPHCRGNGMFLAERLRKATRSDIEVVHLYEENIGACRGCGGCASGECVLDDKMRLLMEKVSNADCLVLSSPLHFTSLSGPMVSFISRLQPWWKYGWEKPSDRLRYGALIITGGSEYRNMFAPAHSVAAAAFNVLGIAHWDSISVQGTDKTPINKNSDATQQVYRLADDILRRCRINITLRICRD